MKKVPDQYNYTPKGIAQVMNDQDLLPLDEEEILIEDNIDEGVDEE